MCVVHWLCEDGKTMCGRTKGNLKATHKQVDKVTCVACKVGMKDGWRGMRDISRTCGKSD